jgi:hypothetical protein
MNKKKTKESSFSLFLYGENKKGEMVYEPARNIWKELNKKLY